MNITLENSLINELNSVSVNMGQNQTKIIREELQLHLNIHRKEEKKKLWEEENKEIINQYNKMIDENGLILKHGRMF